MSRCLTDACGRAYQYRLYFDLSDVAKCLIVKISACYCHQSTSIWWTCNWRNLGQSWIRLVIINDCLVSIFNILIFYVELHWSGRSNGWHCKVYEVWGDPIVEICDKIISESHFDIFGEEVWEVSKYKNLISTLYKAFIWLNRIDLNIFFEVKIEIRHLYLVIIFDEKSDSDFSFIRLGFCYANNCSGIRLWLLYWIIYCQYLLTND